MEIGRLLFDKSLPPPC